MAHRITCSTMRNEPTLKKILLITCLASLLSMTGCILAEDGGRGHERGREHGRYEGRSEVIVGPPVVVVRPPEIIVH